VQSRDLPQRSSQLGPPSPEVPALIAALGDANETIHGSAAEALGKMGPAAVPALIAAFGDANWLVPWRAPGALARIGRRRCRR
jgi:HEAT repeat protein